MKSLSDCLRDKAFEFDDGISDVTSVGVAIAPMCFGRARAVAEAYTRGKHNRVTDDVEQFIQREMPEWAAGAVLTVRQVRARDRVSDKH